MYGGRGKRDCEKGNVPKKLHFRARNDRNVLSGDLIRQKYPEAKIVFVARSEEDSPKVSFALKQAGASYVRSIYDTKEELADAIK